MSKISAYLSQKQNIFKNSFMLAILIAMIGSLGNALQGVYNKYYCETLNISTFQLLTIRCFVEIIILLPFCIKNIKSLFKTWKIVLFLSFLYSCDILLYHTGLQSVSVNTGSLIMLLVPFWMCVIGRIILKETFSLISIIALIICVIGVCISIAGEINFNGFQIGMIFILTNSIVLPIGVILQKKFNNSRPVVFAIFTNAIMLSIIGYILSYMTTGQTSLPVNYSTIKASMIVAIFDCMECAGVYMAANMTYVALLQPVRFTRFLFASILSAFILHQTINNYQVIGGIIILIANLISVKYSNKYHNNKH